ADERKGNVLLHSRSLLGFDQIFPRGLEEIHGRLVLKGRGVRQIDNDLRTFERFGKAFASDCVDACIGRRCKSLMPTLRQLAHDLRTDEPGSSDYHDLHHLPFIELFPVESMRWCYANPGWPAQANSRMGVGPCVANVTPHLIPESRLICIDSNEQGIIPCSE